MSIKNSTFAARYESVEAEGSVYERIPPYGNPFYKQ